MAAVLAAAITGGPLAAAAGRDEPSLRDVVRRMGAYVQTYGEKASIVVATERYTQHLNGSGSRLAGAVIHRTTVADFAIVKAEGLGGWIGFRDVVEVDGAKITDHEGRLIQLLTASSGSTDEARRLSDESARFNIGSIMRNFNVPTTALFFFRPENLDRFKFTRKSVAPDGIWEIAFRETARPTLIRTPDGGFVPSEGNLWVDPANGTVVRTRMRMSDFGTPPTPGVREVGLAQIDVAYTRVPALDMWLPATMTESYETSRGTAWDRTTGEARYTDYRQFQTTVRIK
jgi:hypothetical protein